MIKLIFLYLYLSMYGALGHPVQTFQVLDDIDNEAEIIEAEENLYEKRLPVIRLAVPNSYSGLHGTMNLGERVQVPQQYAHLHGLMNLEEKAIPEVVISKLSASRHPKFEVEQIQI
ncbi:PREDICTED: uncharacterized protein LOC105359514 [Ceratosolen solmsi marchali]|uniref:Uncharacterized protein LOC105359514 n=1 Tax=Ceratosolen solmsi marchali TaxID=326594 RepID=A0AAJ6YBJ7_9HYME|nr:PREDICTED: uncharacterized protein LOC105359514 [Ceratosolen solmsi marchali]